MPYAHPLSSSRRLAQSWPYPRHRRFEEELRAAAAAWFQERGYKTHPKYPYCLADLEADWRKNLILPEVADFIVAERTRAQEAGSPFPLHKYAHHGLSSQAMAFNLVGPLIARGDLTPLRALLESRGLTLSELAGAEFEFDDRGVFNEDSGQPTSVDLVLRDSGGSPRVFIEAKLVETEFGGCSVFWNGDCDGRNPATDMTQCYLHHIGRRYLTLMRDHGFFEGPLGVDTTCIMASYYQFFRELLFAVELGGSFVLLSDDRSPTFHTSGRDGARGLMPFLLGLVPEGLRGRVHSISIQQVVASIRESGGHDDWIGEFERKYGLRPSVKRA
jgi:hypothetical protein